MLGRYRGGCPPDVCLSLTPASFRTCSPWFNPGGEDHGREPGGSVPGGLPFFHLLSFPPSRSATRWTIGTEKKMRRSPSGKRRCLLNPPGPRSSFLQGTSSLVSSPAGRPLEKVGTQLGRPADCARVDKKAKGGCGEIRGLRRRAAEKSFSFVTPAPPGRTAGPNQSGGPALFLKRLDARFHGHDEKTKYRRNFDATPAAHPS
jgi:hypothetical protein